MPEPAQVIVVRESASLLGPILIASGALLAAILTVLTANWRHRKQLEHDQEVQRALLRQDRELRYREHVQQVLDTAMDQAAQAVLTIADGARTTEAIEADPARRRGQGLKLEKTHMAASRDSFRALTEARSTLLRLLLRFGGESDVTETLDALLRALKRRVDAFVEAEQRMRTEEEKAADRRLAEEIHASQAAFHRACAKWHAELIAHPSSVAERA